MGLEILLPLELCHGAPVALWHLGHPAFGIVALLDGNGVIKALPEKPVASLSLIRRGHLEVLQRADNGLARSIKQRLFVGAVIDEEGLVLVAGAEVAPQEGENPVFRLNLAAQDAAQLREADKAFEQMDLALEVCHVMGIPKESVIRSLETFRGVPGRGEIVRDGDRVTIRERNPGISHISIERTLSCLKEMDALDGAMILLDPISRKVCDKMDRAEIEKVVSSYGVPMMITEGDGNRPDIPSDVRLLIEFVKEAYQ